MRATNVNNNIDLNGCVDCDVYNYMCNMSFDNAKCKYLGWFRGLATGKKTFGGWLKWTWKYEP